MNTLFSADQKDVALNSHRGISDCYFEGFNGHWNKNLFESSFFPQGKRKGGKKKINLRQPPFHLQDGDILGVKVISCWVVG